MKLTLLFLLAILTCSVVTAQTPAPKYAYVDTDYVISRLPDTQEMNQAVEEAQKRLQQDYEKKQQQLQTLYTGYMKNRDSLVDSVKAKAEAAINALGAELKQFPAEAEKTIQNTQRLYMATIYLKVGNAIAAVGEANGISIILPATIQSRSFLLYADPALNISDLVLQQFGIGPEETPEKK